MGVTHTGRSSVLTSFFFFFLQNFSAIQYQLVPPEQHTQAVVCSTMPRPLHCRGMLMQLLVSKVLWIKSCRGPLLYRRESEMWTGKVPSESLESINLFLLVITIFGSIKFSFSEKATKICAIFLMVFKTIRTIAHIFVTFSEKLNK